MLLWGRIRCVRVKLIFSDYDAHYGCAPGLSQRSFARITESNIPRDEYSLRISLACDVQTGSTAMEIGSVVTFPQQEETHPF